MWYYDTTHTWQSPGPAHSWWTGCTQSRSRSCSHPRPRPRRLRSRSRRILRARHPDRPPPPLALRAPLCTPASRSWCRRSSPPPHTSGWRPRCRPPPQSPHRQTPWPLDRPPWCRACRHSWTPWHTRSHWRSDISAGADTRAGSRKERNAPTETLFMPFEPQLFTLYE